MTEESINKGPQPADSFNWPLANGAEDFLRGMMARFLERNTFARVLAERMRNETATDFFEWIDHLTLSAEHEQRSRGSGFLRAPNYDTPTGQIACELPQATLPHVLLTRGQPKDSIVV